MFINNFGEKLMKRTRGSTPHKLSPQNSSKKMTQVQQATHISGKIFYHKLIIIFVGVFVVSLVILWVSWS